MKDLDRVDEVASVLVKRMNRETDAYGGSYVAMTIQNFILRYLHGSVFWMSMCGSFWL